MHLSTLLKITCTKHRVVKVDLKVGVHHCICIRYKRVACYRHGKLIGALLTEDSGLDSGLDSESINFLSCHTHTAHHNHREYTPFAKFTKIFLHLTAYYLSCMISMA